MPSTVVGDETPAAPGRPAPTQIVATSGLRGLRLREVWAYRELAYILSWRDLKVRYKQTAIGAAWAVLQPVLMMVVLTVFFGELAHVKSEGVPYVLFSFTALVPWTLFSNAVTAASQSLIVDRNLVEKAYFPRLVAPMAAIGSYLVDYVIAVGLLCILMPIFGRGFLLTMVWLPVLTVGVVAVTLAIGVASAALNARYRDVQYAIPFLLQIWLFVTPVVYSASIVPARYRWLYSLNPMAGVIDGYRWAVLGIGPRPGMALVVSLAVTVVLLGGGLAYFTKVDKTLADVI